MSAISTTTITYTANISIEVDTSKNLQSMDLSHLHAFAPPSNLTTHDLNTRVKKIEECEATFRTLIDQKLYLSAGLSDEENQMLIRCATRELCVCMKDKTSAAEELAIRNGK